MLISFKTKGLQQKMCISVLNTFLLLDSNFMYIVSFSSYSVLQL